MTNPLDLIERYFRLAPGSAIAAYFAQFAVDAIVEDEGQQYRGIDAIRAWRREVPKVSYTVGEVELHADENVVHAEVAGDFPGSPVTLAFGFRFADDGRIQRLVIRP
jgi:SnoaL-like protein